MTIHDLLARVGSGEYMIESGTLASAETAIARAMLLSDGVGELDPASRAMVAYALRCDAGRASAAIDAAAAAAGVSVQRVDPGYARLGSVAVVNVWGVLDKADADVGKWGTSYASVVRQVDAAMVDREVGAVLLRVDSPGGAARAIEPFGDQLSALVSAASAAGLPVVALADDLMASAALWIGSQASAVYATPGAWIGSIGVRLTTVDFSQALDREGIKVNTIKTGEFKDLGSPFRAMTDRDRAKLQAEAEAYLAPFKSAVARGRRLDAARVDTLATGEGWIGKAAVSAGLADAVRPSLAAVVRELNQSHPAGAARSGRVLAASSPTITPNGDVAMLTAIRLSPDAQGGGGTVASAPGASAVPTPTPTPTTSASASAGAGAAGPTLKIAGDVEPKGETDLRARAAAIRTIAAAAGDVPEIKDLQLEALSDPSITLDAFRDKIIAAQAKKAPATGNITIGVEARDRFRSAMELLVLDRSNPSLVSTISTGHNADDPNRGDRMAQAMGFASAAKFREAMSAMRSSGLAAKLGGQVNATSIVRACAINAGVDPARLDFPDRIFEAGMGSGDFPLVTENVMNKVLLASAALQPTIFRLFCEIGSFSDFRELPVYRTSEVGSFAVVPEGKDVTLTTFGERKEKALGQMFGVGVTWTEQLMRNDDLGVLARVPASVGNDFEQLPERLVCQLLQANSLNGPTLSDSVALFDAAHGNLETGAALGVAALLSMAEAFAKMTDFGAEKKPIRVDPRYVIVPTKTLYATAQQLYASTTEPGQTNSNLANRVGGMFQPLYTPYLRAGSATGYYGVADPSSGFRPIVVKYMDGRQTPRVLRKPQTSNLKVEWEFTGGIAVAAQDFEAIVRNPGA